MLERTSQQPRPQLGELRVTHEAGRPLPPIPRYGHGLKSLPENPAPGRPLPSQHPPVPSIGLSGCLSRVMDTPKGRGVVPLTPGMLAGRPALWPLPLLIGAVMPPWARLTTSSNPSHSPNAPASHTIFKAGTWGGGDTKSRPRQMWSPHFWGGEQTQTASSDGDDESTEHDESGRGQE